MGAHTNITGYGISINNGKATDKGLLGSITNVGVTPSPQHYFFTKKNEHMNSTYFTIKVTKHLRKDVISYAQQELYRSFV